MSAATFETFRADVGLVQLRRGVTSATLDRSHVEAAATVKLTPRTASPGRRPPAGPRPPPPPQHPYSVALPPCAGRHVSERSLPAGLLRRPDANTIPGLMLQRSGSSRFAVPRPECLRSAHAGASANPGPRPAGNVPAGYR